MMRNEKTLERFHVMRTVDSQGNLVGSLDSNQRGLIVARCATMDEAIRESQEDYNYHRARTLPVGAGCYYILDTESGEHLSSGLN